MSIQLTPSQQAVVDDRGGSLLVSAAAGSGKTRVLVERLFRRILGEEQANVDEFLIITFTRAAAAELRDRIAQELSDRMADHPGDRHLQRQLMLVYQADIKTIDGFCTSLLRENVHMLSFEGGRSLTADFRVLDDAEAELIRRRVLPRVLEEFYSNLTPGGALLADAFGFGRDDRGLEALVLELYNKIQSHAYPEKWLAEQIEKWKSIPDDVGETVFGQELLDAIKRKVTHWIGILRDCIAEMEFDIELLSGYGKTFLQDVSMLEAYAGKLNEGWDSAGKFSLEWVTLSGSRKSNAAEFKEKLKSIRKRCKAELGKMSEILSVGAKDAADDLKTGAGAMEALLSLCASFSEAYRQEKLRRNVTDFSDQEHYAVALLLNDDGTPTELARMVSQRYLEIMVDEYQDTNEVQNCIFTAISRDGKNLFTVGDIKQSIYRFRLADPTIFLEKYLSYPHADDASEGEPRKILLSQNFRSRQPVLDATNFVFRAIMSKEMGEMDYGDEEQLNFGASYLPERSDCKPEFHLLDAPSRSEDKVSRALLEARFVAERVRSLLDEGYSVADGASLRPCRPDDIVVIMRSPGPRLRYYTRAFAERGIPCSIQENEDFFASMEVAVVYAFLQVLDNPRQDVPLIAVLRSPVFGFSPDRLAVIRGRHTDGDFFDAVAACEDEDCVGFLEKLSGLRVRVKDMSVHRALWHLYNTFNILGVFGAMANGDRRRDNLIALYEHAKNFENAGYKGLFSFVTHLRFMLENGKQPAGGAAGGIGGVQIMSTHKSKGLEFPIVILADLCKSFNKSDLNKPVLVHPKLGLGPICIDLQRHISYSTVARDAIAQTMSREMRSEEMRMLYVGMTRAKEKLIMVATMQSAAKKLKDLLAVSALPVPAETVDSAASMAEWILLPLLQRREAFELRSVTGTDEGFYALTEDTQWQVVYHDALNYAHAVYAGEMKDSAVKQKMQIPFDREAMEFVYPHKTACLTSTKLTATQLKGRVKDEEISEDTPRPYYRSSFEAPRFLQDEVPLTAAQRGTATHLVMQHLPLDGNVDEVLDDLVNRHLLTAEQAKSVNRGNINRFLASPLADELRAADFVEREYRFSLLVDAGDYYENMSPGDQILLQGVVDLFAETEKGILIVDFKTDYVTEENLDEKVREYRSQVEVYSNALCEILGKKVYRKVLYFLRTGEAVEV